MDFWGSVDSKVDVTDGPCPRSGEEPKAADVFDLIARTGRLREDAQECHAMLRKAAFIGDLTGGANVNELLDRLSAVDATIDRILDACGQSKSASDVIDSLSRKLAEAASELHDTQSCLDHMLRSLRLELRAKEEERDHLNRAIELLGRLLTPPSVRASDLVEKVRMMWQSIYDMMDHELESYPHEGASILRMQQALDLLEKTLIFRQFDNKTTVGLGGSFSAGKSSFVNTLLGEDILPCSINPSTAYPTYVCQASEEMVAALNSFGQIVHLDRGALLTLSHQFFESFSMELRHVVKSLWFCSHLLPFEHIRFLDTPGYSKGELGEEDRMTAFSALAECEALVWLVDCERGGIVESDKRFLDDLGAKLLPLLVIINKADLKPRSELDEIVAKVERTMREAGYSNVDVVPLSCHASEEFISELDRINAFLGRFNRPARPTSHVLQIVTDVLSQYSDYHERKVKQAKSLFDALGTVLSELSFHENTLVNTDVLNDLSAQARRQHSFSRDFVKRMEEKKKEFSRLLADIDQGLGIEAPRTD